ncbi:MAG: hypothetical protein M3483_05165, partial [Gemmatimonadota bacterium]|nr:hypothetical protein [Gemmatimonadota bacterium]
YLRRMEGADVQGTLSRVRFAPGSERGSFVRVDRLAGRVRFFRTPFRLSRVRGEIAVLSDRVEFRAPAVLLNRTPLVTGGVIHLGESGEEPRYDVVFQSDSVSLGDFRWLYPRFPEEAHGALTLRIETRPEGTLFLAREVRLRAPGTRLSGNFGMIAGDTLRFVEVELRADPLRVSVIEEMLPEGLPVTGLRIGAVEILGEAGSPPLTRQP